MIRLDMKNYNTTLTEKLQKYQHYHQARLTDQYEYLNLLIKKRVIEQANFTYSLQEKLWKNKQKQSKIKEEKQIKVIEYNKQ